MNPRITAILFGSITCMLAPDTGGGGGGGADNPPTLENQLDAARSERDTAQDSLSAITAERDAARQTLAGSQAEVARLTSQFESATAVATAAQNDLATARASLASLNVKVTETESKLATADGNISRLESLCEVKGIDSKAAVPVAGSSAADSTVYQQWKALRKTDPAKAQAFYRENRAALENYHEAQAA